MAKTHYHWATLWEVKPTSDPPVSGNEVGKRMGRCLHMPPCITFLPRERVRDRKKGESEKNSLCFHPSESWWRELDGKIVAICWVTRRKILFWHGHLCRFFFKAIFFKLWKISCGQKCIGRFTELPFFSFYRKKMALRAQRARGKGPLISQLSYFSIISSNL